MAFKAWETPQMRGGGKKITKDMVSITYKKGYATLSFGQELSREFVDNDLHFIEIMQDDITGEIGLNINKKKGCSLSKTGTKGGFVNMRLQNKVWITKLCQILGVPKGSTSYHIQITKNLSQHPDNRFYRIINNSY